MNKITWGIIGCGDVTEIKSGPAFNLVPNSQLAAVMRRDAAKAADYARRHHVKRWYKNANDLINDKNVNAIYIATPPAFHEEYSIAAFKAGKHVYVEKPMALDSTACERMQQASEKYSCKLSIAHYRRAQPKFIELERIIKQNVIGKILSVKLNFRQAYHPGTELTWRVQPEVSGGGLFHDLAPHQLDLMIFYFGKPVHAYGQSFNKGKKYNADDFVKGEIEFENSIQFEGEWDFNARPEDEIDLCEITGDKGSLRFAVFSNLCELRVNGKDTGMNFDHLPHVQQPMIGQVVNYFLNKGQNPCAAADAIEVMKVMDIFTT